MRANRKSEAHADGSEQEVSKSDFGRNLKDMPKASCLLLKNPVNMFVNFVGVFEAMTTGGMSTFLPKLLENQFHQTAANAAMISGISSAFTAISGRF